MGPLAPVFALSVALAGTPEADALRALPEGGTAAWDASVRALLLVGYDADGSGALDTPAEIAAPGCEVWRAVDVGVRTGWARGLDQTYGVAGGFWLGFVLGVDVRVRAALHDELARCGLEAESRRSVESTIRALPTGGTATWDIGVRSLLLNDFDGDRDGWIGPSEVRRVPCTVWHAVDRGVRDGWGAGLSVVYGFQPELVWVGFALGFDERSRTAGGEALELCGLVDRPLPAAPDREEDVARWITTLPDGGTGRWDGAVQLALVRFFDRDGDGQLSTWAEVRSPGCDVWAALDDGARQRWPDGLGAYGLTSSQGWAGYALGLGGGARAYARDVLQTCGIAGERAPQLVPDTALARDLRRLPGAGGQAWTGRVRHTLLDAVDLDQSGAVDAPHEVDAVGCAAWGALDVAFRRSTPVGVYLALGASGAGGWSGTGLGIDGRRRADVADALERCGLGVGQAARGGAPDPSRRLRAITAPLGTSRWDTAAKRVLLDAADLDGTGIIDSEAEVIAVGCPLWRGLDQATRAAWPVGLVARYGLADARAFSGVALGLEPAVRGAALRAARRCGAR
jgi:hypothetical protein